MNQYYQQNVFGQSESSLEDAILAFEDSMPKCVDDSVLQETTAILSQVADFARSLACAANVSSIRVVYFFTLGTLLLIRLIMKVGDLEHYPICCLQKSCQGPLDLCTILKMGSRREADGGVHEWVSLTEMFSRFLPRFVHTGLGINNVIGHKYRH